MLPGNINNAFLLAYLFHKLNSWLELVDLIYGYAAYISPVYQLQMRLAVSNLGARITLSFERYSSKSLSLNLNIVIPSVTFKPQVHTSRRNID